MWSAINSAIDEGVSRIAACRLRVFLKKYQTYVRTPPKRRRARDRRLDRRLRPGPVDTWLQAVKKARSRAAKIPFRNRIRQAELASPRIVDYRSAEGRAERLPVPVAPR
jgi:hypothetical protein